MSATISCASLLVSLRNSDCRTRYIVAAVTRTAPLLLSALMTPLATTGQESKDLMDQIRSAVSAFHGVMGLAALELTTGTLYEVNGHLRFPTASTIKTAIMIEAWHQAREGRLARDTRITLRETDKVGGSGVLNGLADGTVLTAADLEHLMIVVSDNTATNLLVERLGTARVNARLDGYGLTNTRLFRPTFRDGRADVLPELEREFGLGMTTPVEMARLMALIAQDQAVDREASEAMRATLRRQQDRAMIPRLLPPRSGWTVGNKTGMDEEKHPGADGVRRHVRGDAAIVTAPGCSYVVAIHARQIEDTRWSVDNEALTTGARISRLLFDRLCRTR